MVPIAMPISHTTTLFPPKQGGDALGRGAGREARATWTRWVMPYGTRSWCWP